MTKTQHYQLNQWDAGDRVLREDFNEDNRQIDAALGTIPLIRIGTYQGTGTVPIEVDVGFKPKIVLIFNTGRSISTSYSGVFTEALPIEYYDSDQYEFKPMTFMTATGFKAIEKSFNGERKEPMINRPNSTYFYIAIG